MVIASSPDPFIQFYPEKNGATLFVYGTHGGLGLAYDADSWFHMENLIAINSNLACRYDDIWHLICF